jgi:hypothetical protein
MHASAGEELVMMSIEAGNYYGLDPTGRRIWEMIGEPQTVSEICARLVAEYDVPPDVCESEVLAFLSELAEQKIIALRTKLAAVRALSGAERRLVAEAALLLGVSRVLLLILPFRRIARLLSRPPAGAPAPVDPLLGRSVRHAVTIAARNVPFRAVCLPQAMAAKFMLARSGQPSTLQGATVVGAAGIDDVTPIARFG